VAVTDSEGARSVEWFAVRCVFAARSNKPWGPHDLPSGQSDYEERITLWQARSLDEAIERAEAEAEDYAAVLECEYLGLAQAYWLPDPPGAGVEVFSLIRRSSLGADPYLASFFETGAERQQTYGNGGAS